MKITGRTIPLIIALSLATLSVFDIKSLGDSAGYGFSGKSETTSEPAPAGESAKPNIIFFLVDDMGWQETSVPFHTQATELNRRYRTPNMERLASEGMKFTQAYASAVCSPTRVSALTGMNAARHRVTNWTLRKNVSPDNPSPFIEPPQWNLNGITTEAGIEGTTRVTPLPALLRTAGYRTIHVGKAHFGAKGTPGDNPEHFGFDVNIAGHAAGGPGSYWGLKNFSAGWRTNPPDLIWDVPGLDAYHGKDIYLTEALTLEAVKAVEKAVADKQPFYLYMSHYAVHAPWEKDDRFYQKYIDAGLKPFEATLASMIEGMDKSLGDLMESLDRLGIADNTIIIFMSDNGSPSQCPRNLPLRGHKLTPYEGGIREPMIVKWPGVTKPGSLNSDPIIIEDFFPTILELAGAAWRGKTLQKVDGISFVPLLKGTGRTAKDRSFVWHFPHNYGGQGPFSALRRGPWKLIYYHADRRMEMFNIESDISENHDLAKENPAKVRELAGRLSDRLRAENALMPTDKSTGLPVPLPEQKTLKTPR
ncbi:MAG: sulfatase [Blastocatellales bacterium]